MERISMILENSQNILNTMGNNDEESIKYIKENQSELENFISKLGEENIYKKYIEIHTIILKSAQEFSRTNNGIYKIQPLFYYLQKEAYEIENNRLRLSMENKEIILNHHLKKIEIHDEFELKNDVLFEKENLPLLIKEIAGKKDLNTLNLLETYIESLIAQAERELEKL